MENLFILNIIFIMIKEVIFFTVIGNITRDIRTVFFNLDQLLNFNSFIKKLSCTITDYLACISSLSISSYPSKVTATSHCH